MRFTETSSLRCCDFVILPKPKLWASSNKKTVKTMENFDHKVLDKFSSNFIKILLANDAISAKQYVELSDMHFYDRIMAISREKDFHIDYDQLTSTENGAPNIKRFDGELYVELEYELHGDLVYIKRQNVFGFWSFSNIQKSQFLDDAKTEDGLPVEIHPKSKTAYFSADLINKKVIIGDEYEKDLWEENPLYIKPRKNYRIEFSVTEVKRVECYAEIEAKDYEEAQDIARYLSNEIDDYLCDSYPADVNDLTLLDTPVYSLKNDSSEIEVEVITVEEDES